MQLSFLEASKPLTKSFSLRDGELQKESYPHVLNFTSHTADVESLTQFYKQLRDHASKYHCLLKGRLNRDLTKESRRGSTAPTDSTDWLCLDLDGIKGIDSVSKFIEILPEEFQNVDYIVQYSCSMGIDPGKGLSAHIIFLLDGPYAPGLLKEWLKHINLNTPSLEDSFTVAASGVVFKWPIDISVAQNDKLIYIAPPTLGPGVEDAFTE